MQFDSNVSSSAGGGSQERPILFNAPMVHAILTGAKTQTRRAAIKCSTPGRVVACDFDEEECLLELENTFNGTRSWKPCPYGKPGDQLGVRETWGLFKKTPDDHVHACVRGDRRADGFEPHYRATDTWGMPAGAWRPSIHMPRWASRITLEIAGVRVERLQDISEAAFVGHAANVGRPDKRKDASKVLTKTAELRMVGNSVSPLPMQLIVAANYTEQWAQRRTA